MMIYGFPAICQLPCFRWKGFIWIYDDQFYIEREMMIYGFPAICQLPCFRWKGLMRRVI